jgi:hypothetical protein
MTATEKSRARNARAVDSPMTPAPMTITSVRDGTHDIATPEAFALAEIVPGNVERSGGDIMFLRMDDPSRSAWRSPVRFSGPAEGK